MSDPRNVAHAKKVTHVKKHQATEGSPADTAAAQSGKKPAATTKHRGPASVASVPQVSPGGGSVAASGSPAVNPSTALEGSMAVLAKLKEMEFYSRANLEGLAALVLTVGDELKQKAIVDPLDEVYSAQNAFQTKLTALIEAYKAECDRILGDSV